VHETPKGIYLKKNRNMKNIDSDSCSASIAFVIIIGFLAFVLREIIRFVRNLWEFFTSPDLLDRVVTGFQAIGIVLGVAVILGVILFLVVRASPPSVLPGGEDEDSNN
jgi:uncharacterized membrane protein YidH (DUF202 family)